MKFLIREHKMQIIKTTIKISESEWHTVGKKTGWWPSNKELTTDNKISDENHNSYNKIMSRMKKVMQ